MHFYIYLISRSVHLTLTIFHSDGLRRTRDVESPSYMLFLIPNTSEEKQKKKVEKRT